MTPIGAELDRVALDTPIGRACAEAGAVVHRPHVLPIGSGVPISMRVLGPDEELEAVAEFAERIRAVKINPDWLSTDVVEGERARCYLARACRDPLDLGKPAGTPAQWRHPSITGPIISWLWVEYADLVATFDPFGGELLTADITDIEAAVEKKKVGALASFGSWKLARYLLSSADRPPTSPTPPSSDGSDSAA